MGAEEVGTPLFLAVMAGKKEVVQIILDAGADPNKGNEQEFSPLGEARICHFSEISKMLENAGAVMWRYTDKYFEYLNTDDEMNLW